MGKDEDRRRLRGLLLEGAASPPAVIADAAYFVALRDRVGSARPCACGIQSSNGIDGSRQAG